MIGYLLIIIKGILKLTFYIISYLFHTLYISYFIYMYYFQVQKYLSLLVGTTKVTTNKIIGLMNISRNHVNKHVLLLMHAHRQNWGKIE